LKFQVIIPARYASTRFPGKPLAEIAGRMRPADASLLELARVMAL